MAQCVCLTTKGVRCKLSTKGKFCHLHKGCKTEFSPKAAPAKKPTKKPTKKPAKKPNKKPASNSSGRNSPTDEQIRQRFIEIMTANLSKITGGKKVTPKKPGPSPVPKKYYEMAKKLKGFDFLKASKDADVKKLLGKLDKKKENPKLHQAIVIYGLLLKDKKKKTASNFLKGHSQLKAYLS
jgi:hypothetical protein